MKRQPRRSSAPAVFTAGKGLNTAGKKWSEPKIPALVKTSVFWVLYNKRKVLIDFSFDIGQQGGGGCPPPEILS